MSALEVRAVVPGDAEGLADLLNAIIARGGTTALENNVTPEQLAQKYLTGPDVICCFVAIDPISGRADGFQTLVREHGLPDNWSDIATFVRVDGIQRGAGSALFAATHERAREIGLAAINATIRADNTGGLTFYGRMGFEDYARIPDVPLKDGTPVDRIRKRFSLQSNAAHDSSDTLQMATN